jgi:hypothetical protein
MRRGCTHATRRVKPLAGRRSVWRRRRASSCVCAHNTNRIDAHAQPLIHRKTNTVTIMPYIDRCVASQSRAASSRVVRVDKFNKREFAALARDSQSALLMTSNSAWLRPQMTHTRTPHTPTKATRASRCLLFAVVRPLSSPQQQQQQQQQRENMLWFFVLCALL